MTPEKLEIITNHVLKVILAHMDKSQAEFDEMNQDYKNHVLYRLEIGVSEVVDELEIYFKEWRWKQNI